MLRAQVRARCSSKTYEQACGRVGHGDPSSDSDRAPRWEPLSVETLLGDFFLVSTPNITAQIMQDHVQRSHMLCNLSESLSHGVAVGFASFSSGFRLQVE